MDKGVIYYSDSRIKEPVKSVVINLIKESNLPVTSCTLAPLDFGNNIVHDGVRGYVSYINQIYKCLDNAKEDYVFFCEHDVLYPKCHFDFQPPEDDVFYYNTNIWRWWIVGGWAVSYDELKSLSGMCVNREFAREHYAKRIEHMYRLGLDKFGSREPRQGQLWGYEPGTKRTRRGGFSDDKSEEWFSEIPIVDIRHTRTFSSPKINLDDFKHPPHNWKEVDYKDIPGWDLDKLFDLERLPLPFSLLHNR